MIKFFAFISLLALLYSIGAANCVSQDTPLQDKSILDMKVSLRLNDTDEELFLRILSRRFEIPIGFYRITRSGHDGETKPISLNVKGKSLRWILNEFVKHDARYKWVVVDDVINILPKSQKTILNAPVEKINLRESTLEEAEFSILALPEVAAYLRGIGLRPRQIALRYGIVPKRPLFSLEMKDTNLSGVLNHMLQHKYCGYWRIELAGDDPRIVELAFE